MSALLNNLGMILIIVEFTIVTMVPSFFEFLKTYLDLQMLTRITVSNQHMI